MSRSDAGVTALPPADEVFHFGRLAMHVRRRVVLDGAVVVPLNARAFDMLEFLIRSRDRVVGRDEISASVWRGLSVGENNLRVQMSALRRALAAHAGSETLILTLPGRGYQFVGDVVEARADRAPEVAASGETIPARPIASAMTAQVPAARLARIPAALAARRTHAGRHAALGLAAAMVVCAAGVLGWRGLVGAPAASAAPRLSIAVLPFHNPTQDPVIHQVASAMTDDLTTDLARMPASIVAARENAAAVRGRNLPVQEIGRALRVRYLVSGSVRGEGDVLHVNAQLLDAITGAHLWAQGFDAPRANLADARDSIISRIAATLNAELLRVESARSLHDHPGDPDALDLFIRAREIRSRTNNSAGMIEAQALLQRALVIQPDDVDVLLEQGDLLLSKVLTTDDKTDDADLHEARDRISAALRLAPRRSQALSLQGRLYATEGQWVDAEYSAHLALTIDPSNVQAENLLATCAQAQGHLDEAVPHIQAVLRLRPDNTANKSLYALLGYIRLLQGRAPDALDMLHRATAGDPMPAPGAESLGHAELSSLLIVAATAIAGDDRAAHELYLQASSIWPYRSVWRFSSYFPKRMVQDAGFKRLLAALHDAGMPWHLDEHDAVSPAQQGCMPGDFSPTPASIPGLETIDIAAAAQRVSKQPLPLVVDLARGLAVPRVPSLSLLSEAEPTDVPHLLQGGLHIARDRAIIVMSDGPAGCRAYDAAISLRSAGFGRVAWFRGGEEIWAASGRDADDKRMQ